MRRRLTSASAAAVLACALLQAGGARAADAPIGATSCTGCHAVSKTVDTAVPHLGGRRAVEMSAAMRDFKSGARPATVMGRIAKGFTDQEIDAISAWFAAQP